MQGSKKAAIKEAGIKGRASNSTGISKQGIKIKAQCRKLKDTSHNRSQNDSHQRRGQKHASSQERG